MKDDGKMTVGRWIIAILYGLGILIGVVAIIWWLVGVILWNFG